MNWRANTAAFLDQVRGRISPFWSGCEDRACANRQNSWGPIRHHRRVKLEQAWYCAEGCLERAAAGLLAAKTSTVRHQAAAYRMPLGLLMVSRGDLDLKQLRVALQKQAMAADGRIGEWLQRLGFSTEQQVSAALSIQWACPTLRIIPEAQAYYAGLLPHTLQEAYSVLPVHFAESSRVLHIGFADRIAHRLLYAVEKMLCCRTVPCLVTASAYQEAIRRIPTSAGFNEAAFESVSDPREMSRIIAAYVNRCGAVEVRIHSCGEYMWARLLSGDEHFNLLFLTAQSTGKRAQSASHR
jgi:hypothetical protein